LNRPTTSSFPNAIPLLPPLFFLFSPKFLSYPVVFLLSEGGAGSFCGVPLLFFFFFLSPRTRNFPFLCNYCSPYIPPFSSFHPLLVFLYDSSPPFSTTFFSVLLGLAKTPPPLIRSHPSRLPGKASQDHKPFLLRPFLPLLIIPPSSPPEVLFPLSKVQHNPQTVLLLCPPPQSLLINRNLVALIGFFLTSWDP